MPLYIRKRIKIAPGLSLNISKSGLGLSAGPRGFKVSHGPRGTQINAGRGGLYYRKSLGAKGASLGAKPQRVRASVQHQVVQPASSGQLNGVALDRRQPTSGRWVLWTAITIGVLYVALGMLVL